MSPEPDDIAAYVKAAAPFAGLAAPALAYKLPRIAEPPAISPVPPAP